MRIPTAIAAAAVLTVLPVGATAQTAQAGDVRCMLTMAAVASNEAMRAAALNGVYYFAGRIASQQPSFDFARGLRAEADKMSLAEFQSEATRCGAILQSVAGNLQTAQGSLRGFNPRN